MEKVATPKVPKPRIQDNAFRTYLSARRNFGLGTPKHCKPWFTIIMMLERQYSIKPGSQYDAGAYVASVASSLVHNMTLELT